MSLIEQAARRLEELRKAGAVGQDPSSPEAVPTPEAIVRVLEARKEAHESAGIDAATIAAGAQAARINAVLGEHADTEPSTTAVRPHARGDRTSRVVTLDLERLKARGYVTPDAPKAQIADEFRVIKRPLLRNAQGRGAAKVRNGNLIMVTSALPGEGKTFTAVNLAMSVAMEYDHTVLLVDGDVAHPGIPRLLGAPESPGLLDLLTRDGLDVADVLLKTNVDKLSFIAAGNMQRRATELLASEQMTALLGELASRYPDRIVIFDSPPLLATTEARVLATNMGQVVMVVAAEATSQNTVDQALATIDSCDIVLMMLNKASPGVVGMYGYYPDNDSR